MHTGVTVYPYSNYRAGMNMYTSGYANHLTPSTSAAGNAAQNSIGRVSTGLISEVVYREDQPLLTQLLLLPLLQQARATVSLAALADATAKIKS